MWRELSVSLPEGNNLFTLFFPVAGNLCLCLGCRGPVLRFLLCQGVCFFPSRSS